MGGSDPGARPSYSPRLLGEMPRTPISAMTVKKPGSITAAVSIFLTVAMLTSA